MAFNALLSFFLHHICCGQQELTNPKTRKILGATKSQTRLEDSNGGEGVLILQKHLYNKRLESRQICQSDFSDGLYDKIII